MPDQIVPVQFGGAAWEGKPAPHALFVVTPRRNIPSPRRMARVVYRAIRMGWSPDNRASNWDAAAYSLTLDSLAPDMTRDAFQSFYYDWINMVGLISRTARLHPLEFARMYNRLKET